MTVAAYSVARVARSEPAPAPVPAQPAPEPRLARIMPRGFRTDIPAPPPAYAPARSIHEEAMERFFPSRHESGGGFMPLALHRDGVFAQEQGSSPRGSVVALGGGPLPSSEAAGAGGLGSHNRDQGGKPASPAGQGQAQRRPRFLHD